MLRNQLVVAIRYLLRHKIYSAINIFGLAIGLAASAMIFTWVRYEYSFDQHHGKTDRIYRLIRKVQNEDGSLSFISGTRGPVAPALQDRFPGIEETVRLWPKQIWIQSGEKGFDQIACLADSNLLGVFSIPLEVGDPAFALAEPNAIIISTGMATKFFGNADPIGETLDLQDSRYFTGEYRVSAIMKNLPATASYPFPFDCVFSTLPKTVMPRRYWENYVPSEHIESFLLLQPETSIDRLSGKLENFAPDFLIPETAAVTRYRLQPLDRVHLHSTADYPNILTGSIRGASYGNARTVYFLSTAACLILFVASINFVNLTTARAIRRAREVGVRKAVGAPRRQLIRQYLTESVLVALISGTFAVGLIELGVRVITRFFELPPGMAQTGDVPLMLLPTCIAVGLLAGCYPALYLSAFDPVRVLKGSTQTGDTRSRARGGLVLAQFAISILLLIGTLTVAQQMSFIFHKDLGFDRDHVVITDIFRRDPDRTLLRRYDVVKQELLKHPDVLGATGYKLRLGLGERGSLGDVRTIKDHTTGEWLQMAVSSSTTISCRRWERACSRGANLDRPEDALFTGPPDEPGAYDLDNEKVAILLNQSAVRRFGFENPLGMTFDMGFRNTVATVVGIVEDFHMGSLHEEIGPMFLFKWPQQYKGLMIRIRGQNIEQTMAYLNSTWDKFVPERSSDFVFLDDGISALYASDFRFSRLVGGFATLANIIACLGLVGLVAFAIEQRVKEVGIRRVLGASSQHIVRLFTDDFARLILVANIIAWPLGYIVMNRWLERFAYRIDLDWTLFALSGAIVLTVAVITMLYGGLRAASTQPTVALRNE